MTIPIPFEGEICGEILSHSQRLGVTRYHYIKKTAKRVDMLKALIILTKTCRPTLILSVRFLITPA